MIRGVVFAHSATTLVHLADLYLQNSISTCSRDPDHDGASCKTTINISTDAIWQAINDFDVASHFQSHLAGKSSKII